MSSPSPDAMCDCGHRYDEHSIFSKLRVEGSNPCLVRVETRSSKWPIIFDITYCKCVDFSPIVKESDAID